METPYTITAIAGNCKPADHFIHLVAISITPSLTIIVMSGFVNSAAMIITKFLLSALVLMGSRESKDPD